MKILMKVEGIECQGCENRIQNSVKNIKGVKKVVASHENGNVIVDIEENVNVNQIKEQIDNIGFNVLEITIEK